MALSIHYQERKFRLRNSRKVVDWLRDVLSNEGFEAGNISFIFTDDEYLREINNSFLEHDYYTDVITFDYTEKGGALEAEIYISTDTVKSNAKEYGVPFYREIYRVMVHGILHLTGYDDISDDEKKVMRLREDFYLNKMV